MANRLRALLLLSLLPFMASAAIAQPGPFMVRGRVMEEGTRKPLSGITVFLEEREDDMTETGPDGVFTLEVGEAGEFSLAATGMGYKKSEQQKIVVGGQAAPREISIYLSPVYVLTEVVVKGARNQDKTAKTVVSGKELMSVAGSSGDPLRGMQALPGITTASDFGSNPAIRGSGPENNAFYVDFMPIGYLFHMGGLVSVINADLVDDFNIYSAAFGPEFADVTGGVIDVKLREPRKDRIVTKAGISLLEADALIEGSVAENQSFYIAARRSYFDLLISRLPEQEGVRITQFPEYYDFQGKYVWRPSADHTVTFQTSGAHDQLKLTLTEEATAVKQEPVLAGDFSLDMSYQTAGVILASKLSPRMGNRLGVSYLSTSHKQLAGQLGHVGIVQDTVIVRDHLNIAAGESHDLLVGIDGGLTRVDLDLDIVNEIPSEWDPESDLTGAPRVQFVDVLNVNFWALSLKDRWRISEPFTLAIGQRTSFDDYFDKYITEPRLGAEYSLSADTLLTAGWGKYHEFPQGNQIIEKFGNPNLSHLKADHYVLGAERQIGSGWSAKVEGYYKDLYNLPVPHETLNYINAGSGQAYGAEVLVKKDRTTDWWGWVSAAYSKTERHNDLTGERFPYPYDQPYILNLVYNLKITPRWTFGAKWRYQAGAPFTPVVGTFTAPDGRTRPVYGELGAERLPSYHRLDLRISAEKWYGERKLEYFAEIINAYNAKNISGYQYNEDFTTREPVAQLPLLPSVGVRAEF